MDSQADTGINIWIFVLGFSLLPLLNGFLRHRALGGSLAQAAIVGGTSAIVMLIASLFPRTHRLSPFAVVAVGLVAALCAAAASVVDSALR